MKLKNSPITPEVGEWYVLNTELQSNYDALQNIQARALTICLAPVVSVEQHGSDSLVVVFDSTKHVGLTVNFNGSLLKAADMAKSLRNLVVAIEKRTGLIFKKKE